MRAIGRLLVDAATCFSNCSSVISGTVTYLALRPLFRSSRLQMYRKNAPTVADAETHFCCWDSVRSSGFIPMPRSLFCFSCRAMYLRRHRG